MNLRQNKSKIYMLCGKARSGKDTTASYIKEICEEQGKTCVNVAFAEYIKLYAKKITNWDGNDETKPRELLQQLGTEIIRTKFGEDFFINRIIDDIKVLSLFFDIITINDTRLKKEIYGIKNAFDDVTLIHLIRNEENELGTIEKKHKTETELNNFNDYDIIIENNLTLEDLKNKIKEIIK